MCLKTIECSPLWMIRYFYSFTKVQYAKTIPAKSSTSDDLYQKNRVVGNILTEMSVISYILVYKMH